LSSAAAIGAAPIATTAHVAQKSAAIPDFLAGMTIPSRRRDSANDQRKVPPRVGIHRSLVNPGAPER
jgi:hypothetical protein